MPPGLARKRIWNKKYPVCVTLAEGEVGEESVVEGQEEEERAERHAATDQQLPVTLYLFGRTGREKEEWFQHFLSASRAGAKSGVSGEENAGEEVFGFTAVPQLLVLNIHSSAGQIDASLCVCLFSVAQKHRVAETLLKKARRSRTI